MDRHPGAVEPKDSGRGRVAGTLGVGFGAQNQRQAVSHHCKWHASQLSIIIYEIPLQSGKIAAMQATIEADELLIAKEQLQELKAQRQCHHDARVALSLFLDDSGQQCAPGIDDSEEEQLLQEQMACLEVCGACRSCTNSASIMYVRMPGKAGVRT